MFAGTANFILSVSPAFKKTDVVVTTQLLALAGAMLDGADVFDEPHDIVEIKTGNNHRRRFAPTRVHLHVCRDESAKSL